MDNLPPQLQSRLIHLQSCIKSQSQDKTLASLDELTTLLCDHYQCFQNAQAILQQVYPSNQSRQVTLPYFLQERNHAQNQTQQETKTHG